MQRTGATVEGTQTARFMRAVIGLAALLVLGVGLPLFLVPARSSAFFVFEIEPPLTACFIGALYLAAAVIEAWSASRTHWVGARASLPGIFVFSVATAVLLVLSRDRLDLGAARTWAWLVVYFTFPVVLAAAWWRQRGMRTFDQPGRGLPTALRIIVALQSIGLLLLGVGLLLLPAEFAVLWAWELTSADAAYRAGSGTSIEPYLGAWALGMGLVAGGIVLEDDARRARPCFGGMVVLGVLAVSTLVRFAPSIEWGRVQAIGLVASITAIGASGVWGLLSARQPVGSAA